jgi:hypothetical protein
METRVYPSEIIVGRDKKNFTSFKNLIFPEILNTAQS